MTRTPWQRQRGQEHDWVAGQQARARDELIRLNAQYKAKHGEDYYLYTSRPGDGQTRVVFTDAVCQGYGAGLRHMQAKMGLEAAGDTAQRDLRRSRPLPDGTRLPPQRGGVAAKRDLRQADGAGPALPVERDGQGLRRSEE